ncbi:MAG: dipicolinate synthase subunit DpsA [Clostridia bacterium]|nr:dipicolinate synthase subunit DpsA [Clostridia bacterium]
MNFSIIGGDLRLVNLAKLLANDKNEVFVFGMEKSEEIEENNKIIKCNTLEEVIYNSKIIIGSIPFSRNNEEMYASFSDRIIKIEDLISKVNKNKIDISNKDEDLTSKRYKDKIFIAGNISNNAMKMLETSYGKVIDIMKEEQLVVLNTIATAEGAIDVAIQNTDIIIHGSKVLILGFGRVAKEVSNKFHGLSAKVTCAARKNIDLAWIKALGYEAVNINELGEDLKKYDIIINTVPQMIIDKEEMQYMKKNVLLIDLASTPGGINTEDVQKMNLKFVWALALPGKIAPVTSAEFIKDTIYDLLK